MGWVFVCFSHISLSFLLFFFILALFLFPVFDFLFVFLSFISSFFLPKQTSSISSSSSFFLDFCCIYGLASTGGGAPPPPHPGHCQETNFVLMKNGVVTFRLRLRALMVHITLRSSCSFPVLFGAFVLW